MKTTSVKTLIHEIHETIYTVSSLQVELAGKFDFGHDLTCDIHYEDIHQPVVTLEAGDQKKGIDYKQPFFSFKAQIIAFVFKQINFFLNFCISICKILL